MTAHHAYNDDSNATRHNNKAAILAWSRAIAFFRKYPAGDRLM